MKNAPVVLFAYNRPWHTAQTLQSLANNHLASETELIVYIDGVKPEASSQQQEKNEQVKKLVSRQKWCKKLTVHTAKVNQGLAKSVIKGVTETLQEFDQVIVVEDDMVLSPYFLQFMNEGLEKYEQNEKVISIHGYCVPIEFNQPTFFLRGADCWGWATWRRGWELFNPDAEQLMQELKERHLQYDFDLDGSYEYTKMLQYQIEGKVDSWAIRWYASAYLQNKLTLYPSKSLVRNIGGDGSGIHVKNKQLALAQLSNDKIAIPDFPVQESREARLLIAAHYRREFGIRGKLKKWLNWSY